MFLATILRGVMHVVNAVEESNKRKAEREIARHAYRIRGL